MAAPFGTKGCKLARASSRGTSSSRNCWCCWPNQGLRYTARPGLSDGAACLYRFFTTRTNYRHSVPTVSIVGLGADTRDVE